MAHRILIVEDEPLIAMLIEDFLDELGYESAGALDTVADAVARVRGGEVDAAILDINLRGGEKSWAIADALDDIGKPFLFASGGEDGLIPERHRHRAVLAKPFTMDAIARALGQMQTTA